LFGSGDALLRIALPLIAGLVALAAALSAALRHESTTPWVCLTIGLSFLAGVAFNLGTPPQIPTMRRVYIGLQVLYMSALIFALVWYLLA